uniref:TIP41-like protein n=1 Tax=Xiphophorus couchianus TaxID=32473 RepID=A0A3B5M1K5_9TELE
MFLEIVSESEAIDVVKKLKNKKSKDCNDIDIAIMKEIIYSIIKHLTCICNRSFLTGTFPDKMKIAKVFPVHKSSDKVMPSSFFLLQRFFLRVDGVLIRINDTRVYYEDGKDYMLREFSTRENTITELKNIPAAFYTDPNEIAQHLTLRVTKCEKLELPVMHREPSVSEAI